MAIRSFSSDAIKFNNNMELIEREANRRKSEKIINGIDISNDIPAVDLIGIRIYDENGKVIGGFNESNMAKSPPCRQRKSKCFGKFYLFIFRK